MIIVVMICNFLFFITELLANIKSGKKSAEGFFELQPYDLVMLWTILTLCVLDFGNDIFLLLFWWILAKWIIYSRMSKLYVHIPKKMKMFLLTYNIKLKTIISMIFSLKFTIIAIVLGILKWDDGKHYIFSFLSLLISISLIMKYYEDISKMGSVN